MSEDLKFQQRWEFRRRDSDVDSSSDNSKSSSSGEPVLKKHKLVSSLISPENDETSGTPRSQPEDKSDHGSGDQFKIGKANLMQIASTAVQIALLSLVSPHHHLRSWFLLEPNPRQSQTIIPE